MKITEKNSTERTFLSKERNAARKPNAVIEFIRQN